MKSRGKTTKSKAPAKRRAPTKAHGKLRVVFSESQIHRRIAQLAAEINRAYKGKTLHLVCIPDDCFVFAADLVRVLQVPVVCHFVTARTSDEASVGGVPVREIRYLPSLDLYGKDVLLVNGIVYSGVTLDFLRRHILAQAPRSLRTASLVEKPEDLKVDVPTDYLAFKSTDTAGKYLVGYGLGHDGLYRNLTCIAALTPS